MQTVRAGVTARHGGAGGLSGAVADPHPHRPRRAWVCSPGGNTESVRRLYDAGPSSVSALVLYMEQGTFSRPAR